MILHELDMLVCGGMEDNMWSIFARNLGDLRVISDVADNQSAVKFRFKLSQFYICVIDAVFTASEKNKEFRIEFRHLPTEFGTDRPAGTGDHHAFTGEVFGNFGDVHLGDRAIEQILKSDFPNLTDTRAAFKDRVNVGDNLELAAAIFTLPDNVPDFSAGCRRDSDDDFVNFPLPGNIR